MKTAPHRGSGGEEPAYAVPRAYIAISAPTKHHKRSHELRQADLAHFVHIRKDLRKYRSRTESPRCRPYAWRAAGPRAEPREL